MDARESPLSGIGVLVTRPAHQAEHLAQLIEADGGRAVRFPTIAIAAPSDPSVLLTILGRLAEYDIAIFVSPNAVSKAMGVLRAQGRMLPPKITIACIGRGTAEELKRFGVQNAVVPAQFDSTGLLATMELRQLADRRIVIFRGDGGRELLGDTLTARGARVEYAECYRRVRPEADATPLLGHWARGAIDIVSVTSTEGLRNLHAMLGAPGRRWLINTPVVVVSAAQAAACRELGFVQPAIVAREAADQAILEAIRTWRTLRISI